MRPGPSGIGAHGPETRPVIMAGRKRRSLHPKKISQKFIRAWQNEFPEPLGQIGGSRGRYFEGSDTKNKKRKFRDFFLREWNPNPPLIGKAPDTKRGQARPPTARYRRPHHPRSGVFVDQVVGGWHCGEFFGLVTILLLRSHRPTRKNGLRTSPISTVFLGKTERGLVTPPKPFRLAEVDCEWMSLASFSRMIHRKARRPEKPRRREDRIRNQRQAAQQKVRAGHRGPPGRSSRFGRGRFVPAAAPQQQPASQRCRRPPNQGQ